MKPGVEGLLDKARHSIHAAEVLLSQGEAEIAVGRAYYAMFYAAEALLLDIGLHFKRHSGTHRAFAQHFVKTGKLDPKFHGWLTAAFDERLVGDYEAGGSFSGEDVERGIARAREFLVAASALLAKNA